MLAEQTTAQSWQQTCEAEGFPQARASAPKPRWPKLLSLGNINNYMPPKAKIYEDSSTGVTRVRLHMWVWGTRKTEGHNINVMPLKDILIDLGKVAWRWHEMVTGERSPFKQLRD